MVEECEEHGKARKKKNGLGFDIGETMKSG
jgi:hypothetical protein